MHLPNGAQIFVEVTRETAKNATAITNGKEPVLTIANSDYDAGDYLIVEESGWAKLANRVVRVKSVVSDAVTIEGVDTTDLNQFPAGSTAKVAKLLTWIEIPCVQDLAQEGGEQQYYTYQCLADDQEQQLPTFKSATSLTYNFADEFDNAIYPILQAADESGKVTALRMFVPKAKEMRCWSGVLSFNDIPNTVVNEMETVSLSVSLKGKFTRLPAATVTP